ncbi:MAG: hypothetical protein BWZ03_00280 [bacterium ADurb.BinA186]|nr:MAG: hypothetical protein BWZ03_00280 [bacterium ADurb.BinA186]
MIDIFIPSYHRPDNLKTVNYFLKIGWDAKKIHVFIDDETDDIKDYEATSKRQGFNLHIFDMAEARRRYDYVHRASVSRRSAGQARNMFFDFAKALNIEFYMVQDDDTNMYQIKKNGEYLNPATFKDVDNVFNSVKDFMYKRRIGLFGVSQTGDFIGGVNTKLLRNKVMNTTFVLTKYIYRGERGVQDDDTSLFTGVMNEGLFTGSLGDGLVLLQTPSATAKGGLTDLYNECKLLNKALVCPIQFPSAIIAEKQKKNGGRLHHRIASKHLYPKLIKGTTRDNIAWDTYPEDIPFTNEPIREKK